MTFIGFFALQNNICRLWDLSHYDVYGYEVCRLMTFVAYGTFRPVAYIGFVVWPVFLTKK